MELLLISISWVLITSVVSNLSYFDYVNSSHSWQQALSYKNKRQSMLAHKYKLLSYLIFLSSSNFRSIKFKPFWLFEFTSHLWQQALSYKKERPELFLHNVANKYGITYLPQLHWSSSNFLSINITAFWLPMALDNKQVAHRIPHKTAKFWKYVWKRVFNSIVTGLSNFLCLEKQGFLPEFSHTSELKFKVRLV